MPWLATTQDSFRKLTLNYCCSSPLRCPSWKNVSLLRWNDHESKMAFLLVTICRNLLCLDFKLDHHGDVIELVSCLTFVNFCWKIVISSSFMVGIFSFHIRILYILTGINVQEIEGTVTSPSGATDKCEVVDLGNNRFTIKFFPKEMGIHTVSLKHKGLHIPGTNSNFTKK